ncbi:hypothetical protein BDW22DRAFT_1354394 [Trametopsis cervina]|nr:hypothetical protein BDW22DRAFT_1354394 [Trametopsis cervina]
MDDTLETPSFELKPTPSDAAQDDDDAQPSEDEDEGPDWTKLPQVARPVIPRRGEKDFEPKVSGGSGLQRHALDRARYAMLDALKATRTTSSKALSHAIWYPNIARAHVTIARGTHFSTMGHSVSRPSAPGVEKMHKRLELLPEEALYLVERGSLFCWRDAGGETVTSIEGEDVLGVPMTVQQAFAEMIGTEGLTLEKYQVYSYLRRLGYAITRTVPPSDAYPAAAPFPVTAALRQKSLWNTLWGIMTRPFARLAQILFRSFDWWRPTHFNLWLPHTLTYPSIFRSLRFLQSGPSAPLHISPPSPTSPYKIFYNLYRPSTPFKKSAPPAPDFSVVVINARTTPVPSLIELHALFDGLPLLPPPVPRRRTLQPSRPDAPPHPPPSALVPSSPPPSFFRRLFAWTWASSSPASTPPSSTSKQQQQPRRPNPFAIMKAGKKMVVVAAVDAGMVSFFRFGEGAFEDFPMA